MKEPNLSYIEKLADGDKKFSKILIEIIKIELPNEIDLYSKNMKNTNFENAASDVHKIKHKISILSFKEGYRVALLHETSLRNGNNTYQEEFEEVLKTLTNYIELI